MDKSDDKNYPRRLVEISVSKSSPAWRQSACAVCYVAPKVAEKSWQAALVYAKGVAKREGREETEESLFKRCALAIEAQTKFRRDEANAGAKTPQPVMLSVWLNQGQWEAQIGSHAELRQKVAGNKCSCGRDVMGPAFSKCDDCYPLDKNIPVTKGIVTMDDLRAQYKDDAGRKGMTPDNAREWVQRVTGFRLPVK